MKINSFTVTRSVIASILLCIGLVEASARVDPLSKHARKSPSIEAGAMECNMPCNYLENGAMECNMPCNYLENGAMGCNMPCNVAE